MFGRSSIRSAAALATPNRPSRNRRRHRHALRRRRRRHHHHRGTLASTPAVPCHAHATTMHATVRSKPRHAHCACPALVVLHSCGCHMYGADAPLAEVDSLLTPAVNTPNTTLVCAAISNRWCRCRVSTSDSSSRQRRALMQARRGLFGSGAVGDGSPISYHGCCRPPPPAPPPVIASPVTSPPLTLPPTEGTPPAYSPKAPPEPSPSLLSPPPPSEVCECSCWVELLLLTSVAANCRPSVGGSRGAGCTCDSFDATGGLSTKFFGCCELTASPPPMMPPLPPSPRDTSPLPPGPSPAPRLSPPLAIPSPPPSTAPSPPITSPPPSTAPSLPPIASPPPHCRADNTTDSGVAAATLAGDAFLAPQSSATCSSPYASIPPIFHVAPHATRNHSAQ